MLVNNSSHYPYASKRVATFAHNGMVATSQPLAAQVGIQLLKRGGNAVDAAVGTAAALTVVEPTGCGIGGDAFAQVWINEQLYGLNASSTAPAALTPERVAQAGYHDKMPLYGWLPVTVPGIPSAWAVLNERWGRLSLQEVLQPAIDLAADGYPVSPYISLFWQRAATDFNKNLSDTKLKDCWFATFAPEGKTPNPGELFRSLDHASTLEQIAESNAESFYRGELAAKIDRFARETGGLIRAEDLAAYQPQWVDPISLNYRGFDICQLPPNGQGLVVLMALNILKGFDFDTRDCVDTLHKQVEALKLAYTDGQSYITQADHMPFSVEELLSESFAKERRDLISKQALTPFAGKPSHGGTVYLATADRDGNMVSFIQSNFHGFGSGVVVPGTGIALQNRGSDFSLDPEHPNYLQPGKRSFHTIIPGFITRNSKPLGPFGVMGAYMQPQGQLQVISNMIDFGLNPQAALDAPRWQWFHDKNLGMECDFDVTLVEAMKARGHQVEVAKDMTSYGRGQIILRDPETGVYCGGTEKRTDGHIACY